MDTPSLSIGELAIAAGLSRRAVRFYVQQRLLPVPTGLGRGRHYNQSHLDRLNEIARLQSAGHSLDAIRRIIDGEPAPVAPQAKRRAARRPAMSAELWTRVKIADGVELHFDSSRFQPEVEGLIAMRELARRIFVEADESKA